MQPAPDSPGLLFISPTHPDIQGNGLAMRAGLFLEALSEHYRVTLLVVPVFDNASLSAEALAERCCERVLVVPPVTSGRPPFRFRAPSPPLPSLMQIFERLAKACTRVLGKERFDVIHAFRFYTAPLAHSIARAAPGGAHPQLHLDLDDVESITHRRLAGLCRLNHLLTQSQAESAESVAYARQEAHLLPKFDLIYVGSRDDAKRVTPLARGDVRLAPNAVRPPPEPVLPLTTHPFTFLFVGTLDYLPNHDAVTYFCREILPKLRAMAPGPFLIRIVGRGDDSRLGSVRFLPEVRFVGAVRDVNNAYADADAVIVPLRGGGGTRIKVLEAFSYRRPVVTTSSGVEGIEVSPGLDCLVGDSPQTFAAQCARLMQDPSIGTELAAHAFELMASKYSFEAFRQAIGVGLPLPPGLPPGDPLQTPR